MTASAPPVIAASASPYWIMRYASPIACAPVVQAVIVARFGPFAPYLIETWPDVMFAMSPGMKNGENLSGPPSHTRRCWLSISGRPPMPEPMTTATRSAFSGVTLNPESSIA